MSLDALNNAIQSSTAEACLLGAMICEPGIIADVLTLVEPRDFYRSGHQAVFEAMIAEDRKSDTFDIVLVRQRIIDSGIVKDVPAGDEYIVKLANEVPTAANWKHYAKIVRDKATIRRVLYATHTIRSYAIEHSDDPDDVLDRAESEMFKIRQSGGDDKPVRLADLVDRVVDNIEHGEQTLPSALKDYDAMAGLRPGELTILAAETSMGKTALMLTLARNLSNNGICSALFSMEMDNERLVRRLLGMESGVSSLKLRSGKLAQEEWRELHMAAGRLYDIKLWGKDRVSLTPMKLKAISRRLVDRERVQCIFIDYLQLMSSDGKHKNREQEVSSVVRSIKNITTELKVPVVCLCQLNRPNDHTSTKPPTLRRLRESGEIEQAADVVMFIHGDREGTTRKLIVAKQRDGMTGTLQLDWRGDTMTYYNHAPMHFVPPVKVVEPDDAVHIPY